MFLGKKHFMLFCRDRRVVCSRCFKKRKADDALHDRAWVHRLCKLGFWSAAGHVAGAGMPSVLQESMSIALYAMFIGLLVPALKKQRKVLFLAGAGALFNTVFQMSGMLSAGWAIVIATLLSAVLIERLYHPKSKEKRKYV